VFGLESERIAFPRGGNKTKRQQNQKSKLKNYRSPVHAPVIVKSSRGPRKVGMSWCVRQGVPVLVKVSASWTGAMSSILSSAQPSTCVCVRDFVLCKVCRDARALTCPSRR
jgi:hypothetical protein